MIDSKSILIVDDHQMFRDSLAFLIKKTFPNTVVETGDSNTSLENKLRSSRSFDVVLIDLNMPGMVGTSTFDQLRAEFPRLTQRAMRSNLIAQTQEMIESCARGD